MKRKYSTISLTMSLILIAGNLVAKGGHGGGGHGGGGHCSGGHGAGHSGGSSSNTHISSNYHVSGGGGHLNTIGTTGNTMTDEDKKKKRKTQK